MTMNTTIQTKTMVFLTILLFSLTSHLTWAGVHSTLQTGEVTNRLKMNISSYLINREGSAGLDIEGLAIMGHVEIPYTESSSWRLGIGKGNFDVQLDGSWKWIPIPDHNNQPAIGTLLGMTYIHCSTCVEAPYEMGLYAQPIISKTFRTNFGSFNTYTGPMMAIMFHESNLWYPIRFAAGSELTLNNLQSLGFMLEGSLNISNSTNAVALGINYLF